MADDAIAPVTAKKRSRWYVYAAVIAGGCLALCCGGIGLLVLRPVMEIGPAGDAAGRYVAAVLAGDAAASSYVCSIDNSTAHHEDFVRRVQADGVHDYRVVRTTVAMWNVSLHARAEVELIGDAGAIETDVTHEKEDDGWKICSR